MGGALEGDTYRNVLFENPGHGNNWVKLKLIGEKANRAAIGARLKLTFVDFGKEARGASHRYKRRKFRSIVAAAGNRTGKGRTD